MKKNTDNYAETTALRKLSSNLLAIRKNFRTRYTLMKEMELNEDAAGIEALLERTSLEKALGEEFTSGSADKQHLLRYLAKYVDERENISMDPSERAQEILNALINEPAINSRIKSAEITESLIDDLFSAADEMSCAFFYDWKENKAICLLTAEEAIYRARHCETFADLCNNIGRRASERTGRGLCLSVRLIRAMNRVTLAIARQSKHGVYVSGGIAPYKGTH